LGPAGDCAILRGGMSQADLETLRSEYEAMSRQDWPAVFRTAHPDFELTTPERSALAGTFHGRDTARQLIIDFFGPFEEVHAEPEEFFERGDRIVVFFRLRSRPKGSSAAVEIRAAHLWTMREGRAARLEIFPEPEKALEAAARQEQGWTNLEAGRRIGKRPSGA
jgi:ketosteroid isomerase-like protein